MVVRGWVAPGKEAGVRGRQPLGKKWGSGGGSPLERNYAEDATLLLPCHCYHSTMLDRSGSLGTARELSGLFGTARYRELGRLGPLRTEVLIVGLLGTARRPLGTMLDAHL